MKKAKPEFWIWWAIFTVVHFLLYAFLVRAESQMLVKTSAAEAPMVLLVSMVTKFLAAPLGALSTVLKTEHFPVAVIYALRILNSALWGTVASLVIVFSKRVERRPPV
jgi:hypothetical protein